ncbi:DedA family protein [Rhodobacter sp.]
MFDGLLTLTEQAGYPGIFLAMFAENVFPPIPSEVIMPLGGFQVARGQLSLAGVILAGTAGATLGALFWYWVGLRLRPGRLMLLIRRHGRLMMLTPAEFRHANAWFRRHGHKAVFWGRLVPGLRSLISVPAGVTRMRVLPFLFWTGLGSLIWTTLLTFGGILLESQYRRIAGWIDPVATAILLGCAAFYLYRVITWRAS